MMEVYGTPAGLHLIMIKGMRYVGRCDSGRAALQFIMNKGLRY